MGLARIEDEAHEIPATQLTQDGSVMGTIDYMAPEQAKDTHTADARSDIYSLGCSLYYLLTAESVYRGSTMVNRIMAHQNDAIPSLSGKHVHIPADIDAVYQKMIAKRPEDRFQSMQEVIDAINQCDLMKSSSTVSTEPSDPELHKFLQSQRMASSPTIAITAEKPLTDSQSETLTSGFLDNTLGGTTFKPLQKRMQSIGKRGWIISGVVLASLILMAGIILKVDTPAGTIILEIDQPEVAGAVVSVDDQQKITIKTGEGKEPIEVVADEKTHTLKVTKGGFQTFTKQFTVKAGGKETIKVRLVPLGVAEKSPASENYALEFDGEKCVVKSPVKYDGTHPLTFECYVRYDLDPGTNPALKDIGGKIIHLMSNQNDVDGMNIHLKWSGYQRYHVYFQTGSNKGKYITRPIPASGVLHIAVIVNGKEAQFYLNGKTLGKPHVFPQAYNASKHPFVIGSTLAKYNTVEGITIASYVFDRFKGIIDEVRISNIARYTKDFTPAKRFKTDKNTMALYHFDEAKGDVLKDSSGNGHDGKIVGAKWVKVDDELQVVKPATTSDTPMTDREVAEWVIGIGGEIRISGKSITKIEQLPALPFVITAVNLGKTSVKDDDLKRLAELKSLKTLVLVETLVSDTGLLYLKDISLNSISLVSTQITDKGLGYLSNMPSLTILYVSETAISNAGVERLKDMIQLDILFLANTQIDDIGLGHLAGLTNLRQLYMNNTRITDSGLKHLKGMKQLQTLGLGATSITNAGLKELTGFKNIERLDFTNCKFSDSGFVHLKDLKSLEVLMLNSTSISDSGLEYLKDLKNLKDLQLRLTSVSDVGLQHLHGLKKLEDLDLQQTKVTPQGIADLQKALPNCKIESDSLTTNDPDRRAAEWVLSIGGQVDVIANDKKVTANRLEDLPKEPFFVASIGLNDNEKVTDDELRLLKDLKQLRELNLSLTPVTNAGMQHLAKLTNLSVLNLYFTSVGDDGLQYLAKLEKLTSLNLAQTKITDVGVKHLTNLRNLTVLSFHGTKSGDKGLEHIKNLIKINALNGGYLTTDDGLKHLGQMKQLTALTFYQSQVTGSGLVHLPDPEKLMFLSLQTSAVTDSGLQNISKCKNLKTLKLLHTQIADAGLKHLESFKRLELLDLQETKVTTTGINALSKKLPQCKITYGPEKKPIVIEPTLR